MQILLRIAVGGLVLLSLMNLCGAQDLKAPGPGEEDSRLVRLIERWIEAEPWPGTPRSIRINPKTTT